MYNICPDLLLITWNRSFYLKKMLPKLFSSTEDFRLHWWDNNSDGETRELFEAANDSRIVIKHRSHENLKQRAPTLWFFDHAKSSLVGKIDDDILYPSDWIRRLSPIAASPDAGMIGCWIFDESDWNDELAKRHLLNVGSGQVLRQVGIQGQSFLARKDLLRQFVSKPGPGRYGFPIDTFALSCKGYVNGWAYPPIFAHNMDDPISEHYAFADSGFQGQSALTARSLGFADMAEYSDWIRADADSRLRANFEDSLIIAKSNARHERLRQMNPARVASRFLRRALRKGRHG